MRMPLEFDSSQWPQVWDAAYRVLEQSIVEAQLKVWIQPLVWVSAERLDPDSPTTGIVVHLRAPNDFSAQWVRDHYQRALESAITQVTGQPCRIELAAAQGESAKNFAKNFEDSQHSQDPHSSAQSSYDSDFAGLTDAYGSIGVSTTHAAQNPAQNAGTGQSANPSANKDHQIDPRFVFENFVVGASNQFGHASAVAVAEKPAHQYNPLFIYSPPGLGKTHLLHAIGNHVMAKDPKARVAYLSAESFCNELIDCLQHQRMPQFRAKYRDSYDVLLIDDIQFIAGKKQTEEEFFHTFNALYSSKRQIVLTSDRPPKEIQKLEERIRTRFEWGLVSDIQPPEIETRIAILKAKAERDDIYLPDDVATFLASHVKSNVRELEGILIRLQAQASMTGSEISLEMAKHVLKLTAAAESSQVTVEAIQEVVARHYQIKVQDLKSQVRTKTFALPRQIAMYLTRKYTGLGYKEIGSLFGGKDHTTILHACNKIEQGFRAETGEIRTSVEKIQNLL